MTHNPIPIRSADLNDDTFTDLEPLIPILADIDVCMLAEYDHGDGATFRLKARLVRFLHEVLDFQVLAWECGVYDMRQLSNALQAGAPAAHAAYHGLHGVWIVEEVLPLLEYANKNGIELPGFDCQITSPFGFDTFAKTAADILHAANAPVEPDKINALDNFVKRLRWDRPTCTGDVREAGLSLIDELATLTETFPGDDARWISRCLRNLPAFEQGASAPPPDKDFRAFLAADNRRDQAMADNLIDLVERAGPKRKTIVWASIGHLARNAPGKTPIIRTLADNVWPRLADRAYVIGAIAHHGTRREWAPGVRSELDPAAEGSLEAQLHNDGLSHAFVDLRSHPGHTFTSQIIGARPTELDWSRVVDGVIFIDEMTPSTKVPMPDHVRQAWEASRSLTFNNEQIP